MPITNNVWVIGIVKSGPITLAYPEWAKRGLAIQRKQSHGVAFNGLTLRSPLQSRRSGRSFVMCCMPA